MHNHISRAIAVAAILGIFLSSCNILEDRNECPCRLLFKAVDLPDGQHVPIIYIYDGNTMKERIEVPAGQLSEGYVHDIDRKKNVEIYVWCDTTGYVFPAFAIDGPEILGENGEDFPALYKFGTFMDTRVEEAEVTIDFNKRFATLNASILNEENDIGGLYLEGYSNGYKINGEPVSGKFYCRPDFTYRDKYVSFSTRLPQQTDDGLMIGIYDMDGDSYKIPLGKILASKGYNWEAKDLMDIELTINGNLIEIRLGNAEWVTGSWGDLIL